MFYLVEFTKPGRMKILADSTSYAEVRAQMTCPNPKGRNRAIVSDTPSTLDLHIDVRAQTAEIRRSR